MTWALWSKIKPMLAAGGLTEPAPEVVDGPDTHRPRETPSERPRDPDPRPREKDKGPKDKGPKDKGPKRPDPTRDPEEPVRPPVSGTGSFPRRTLLISVHNYLYANPILNPLFTSGPRGGKTRILDRFMQVVNDQLRVPANQTFHVSDMAPKNPVPPMKAVVEKALTDFLESSRRQDRIMVFFVGHSVELNDKPYLVPIEGEMDNADTLIPLEWVFEQMGKCQARQKVLVLDAHRFNPGQGIERPVGGPMGPKFEALVKNPPAGVQVLAACSAGQQSFETDDRPAGVLLDSIRFAFSPPAKDSTKPVMAGRIQQSGDLIPIEKITEAAGKRMAAYLEPRKMVQAAQLTGKDMDNGSAVDPKEPAAAALVIPQPKTANMAVVKDVLDEISVPPLKVGQSDAVVSFNALPPFSPDAMKKYEGKSEVSAELTKAIRKARVNLWALSPNSAPSDVAGEVSEVKGKLGGDLNVMQSYFAAPPAGMAEVAFKNKLAANLKGVSKLITAMEEALDGLKEVDGLVKDAPMRWQANYTFMRARIEEQLTLLEEYEGALGSMRKDFPPRDANLHSGWRLASKTKASDSAAKKYDKSTRKFLGELIEKHGGTPWEVLAKREKLTSLGLDWQAANPEDK
jgi:hypothetical protein